MVKEDTRTKKTLDAARNLSSLKGSRTRVKLRVSRQRANAEKRILDAAQIVFAHYGFRGASVDEIAKQARIPQPNLLYYFKTKKTLYLAVLERILDEWLTPLSMLDPDGDPATEIRKYIAEKVEASRTNPTASRVFANEILHGAVHIEDYLRTDLRQLVDQKVNVIQSWIKKGKLVDVDAYHLIFFIWAATQHYADFMPQVKAITGSRKFTSKDFDDVSDCLTSIILNGILPRG